MTTLPGDSTDTAYRLTPAEAAFLAALVAVSPAERVHSMRRMVASGLGVGGLVRLFSTFVSVAQSVVANNRALIETALVAHGEDPHTIGRVNLPCLLGALSGAILAADIEQDGLCSGCAYRLGTPANQCAPTLNDAIESSVPGTNAFWCHEELRANGDPVRKCRGSLRARRRPAPAREAEHAGT